MLFGKSQCLARQVQLISTLVLGSAICCSSLFAQAETGYSGRAYGTKVVVAAGTTGISAGTTAVSVLCTEETGVSNSNSVTTISLPPLASTGVVDTSV
jgi:hypothetical protein